MQCRPSHDFALWSPQGSSGTDFPAEFRPACAQHRAPFWEPDSSRLLDRTISAMRALHLARIFCAGPVQKKTWHGADTEQKC